LIVPQNSDSERIRKRFVNKGLIMHYYAVRLEPSYSTVA
jgi:hypothetical protein